MKLVSLSVIWVLLGTGGVSSANSDCPIRWGVSYAVSSISLSSNSLFIGGKKYQLGCYSEITEWIEHSNNDKNLVVRSIRLNDLNNTW